jgi:hypothetical protein
MARKPHAKPAVEVEHEQRELDCTLTEPEALVRGDEMAAAEVEIEGLESQRKGLNGQIADLRERRRVLAHVIESGTEKRMVQCTWTADYGTGMTTCVRDDTGEVLAQRPLTAGDRQTNLLPVPPPVPAPTPIGIAKQHEYGEPLGT